MEKGYTICVVLMALFMGVQCTTNLNSLVGKTSTDSNNIIQALNNILRPLQELITKLTSIISNLGGTFMKGLGNILPFGGGGGAPGKPGTAIATAGQSGYGGSGYDGYNDNRANGVWNGPNYVMNAKGKDGEKGADSIFWPFGRSGADGKAGGIISGYGTNNIIRPQYGNSNNNNRIGKTAIVGGRDNSRGNPSMFMDQNGNGYGASYQNGNGYYGGNLYESSLKNMDENGNIFGGKNNGPSSSDNNNNDGLFGSGGLLSKLLPRGQKGSSGKPGFTGVGNGIRIE